MNVRQSALRPVTGPGTLAPHCVGGGVWCRPQTISQTSSSRRRFLSTRELQQTAAVEAGSSFSLQSFVQDPLPNMEVGQQEVEGVLKAAEGMVGRVENLELVSIVSSVSSVLGAAWATVTAPAAIFSSDTPVVNVLFILAFALLAYNIVVKAPKQ